MLHVLCLGLLTYVSWQLGNRFPFAQVPVWMSWGVFAVALVYQQSIVSTHDLSRVGRAFFTTNGVASLVYATVLIAGVYLS
jgi:4-hydroxybenzoate polyprenyltransferase